MSGWVRRDLDAVDMEVALVVAVVAEPKRGANDVHGAFPPVGIKGRQQKLPP